MGLACTSRESSPRTARTVLHSKVFFLDFFSRRTGTAGARQKSRHVLLKISRGQLGETGADHTAQTKQKTKKKRDLNWVKAVSRGLKTLVDLVSGFGDVFMLWN